MTVDVPIYVKGGGDIWCDFIVSLDFIYINGVKSVNQEYIKYMVIGKIDGD